MRFTLEEFQAAAVRDLLSKISRARRDHAEDGERTAIGLTAPTGAGKTVIATAVLEGLYYGTPDRDPDPDLTVLWVTDDKSLNAQTIAKISQASGRLDEHRIRFLGETDERTLEPGFVYFTHIQQLQKKSTLHAWRDGVRSDHRTHGAWEMIANTVTTRGSDLLVVWDEAHRGSGTSRNERRTIVSTIVDGGTTNIGTQQPAAPVVLGISATPERFHAAMATAGRSLKHVAIPPSAVRSSGLLKDRILIRHLAEEQAASSTMLQLAVADLKAASEVWQAHHAATGDRLVEPLLVVQVEPKVGTDRLGSILATLESAWPELSDFAVAHSFGDPHGPLRVGDRTVRYLAPEAISGDDRARVVLFKNALTTGWDCPRAEVLVSFQGKDSYTEIAQLIGRLVRTPLADRVEGDDRLNEVVAYLPGYRTEHVASVVRALTEDETVEVDVVISPETCVPDDHGEPRVFELLEDLPSYSRPRVVLPSRTAQLMRLAAALHEHGIVTGASGRARRWLVGQVRAADDLRSDEVDELVRDYLSLTLGTTTVGYGAEVTTDVVTADVATVERDLEGYYARAQRLLPDGTAAWYYNDLCERGTDDVDAMARVAALAALGFRDLVEEHAVEQIRRWRSEHGGTLARRARSVRDQVEPLWFLGSSDMVPTTVSLPAEVRAGTQRVVGGETTRVEVFHKHLFTIAGGRPDAGMFPVRNTGWEDEALRAELAEDALVAWYRNPPSGKHALAIPYEYGEETRLFHPDFLFFHGEDDGEIVIDIVDPHRHTADEAGAKWAALATYALDHPDHLRRVVAVIRDRSTKKLRSLDLRAEGIVDLLRSATDGARIEALFDEVGTDY